MDRPLPRQRRRGRRPRPSAVAATEEDSLAAIRDAAADYEAVVDGLEGIDVPEEAPEEVVAHIDAYVAGLRALADLYEETAAEETLQEFDERTSELDEGFLQADVASYEIGAFGCVIGNVDQLREVVEISDAAAEVIEAALLAWSGVLDTWGLGQDEIDCITAELARRYVTEELDPAGGEIDNEVLLELIEDCVGAERFPEVTDAIDAFDLELASWEQALLAEGFTQKETDCLTNEIAGLLVSGELEPGPWVQHNAPQLLEAARARSSTPPTLA